MNQQPALSRGRLETAAYVSVIVGVVAFIGETALEYAKATSAVAAAAAGDRQAVEMVSTASSSPAAAHAVFTNLHGFPASACFKGVVTNDASGAKVESIPVCTGEVQPRSTFQIDAPYAPGAIVKLCPDDTSQFGGVDWSKCSFTLVDVE